MVNKNPLCSTIKLHDPLFLCPHDLVYFRLRDADASALGNPCNLARPNPVRDRVRAFAEHLRHLFVGVEFGRSLLLNQASEPIHRRRVFRE